MSPRTLQVPAEWQSLELDDLSGVLLVTGAPDSGKTSFAHYLFDCFRALGRRVAFIDGDPGQSALGPPTTLTLTFEPGYFDGLQNDRLSGQASPARVWRYFIGSTSPQGHMLPMVVGAARLVQLAREAGAQVMVYDTCGLVDPAQGGLALKNAKIDLLRPRVVFAIQKEDELEPLLVPLRRSGLAKVVMLRPSSAAARRDASARREYRALAFERYFGNAKPLDVEWGRIAVFPFPAFRIHRLAALEDSQGLTLGLGTVVAIDRPARRIRLLTPLHTLAGVNALRLGDVLVNPETLMDERISG